MTVNARGVPRYREERTGLGGIVALLGSAAPFSVADGGVGPADEGTLAWPSGLALTPAAPQMAVA